MYTVTAGGVAAQSFTMSSSGNIVEVRLSMNCDATVSLRRLDANGIPLSQDLAAMRPHAATNNDPNTPKSYWLDVGVRADAGEKLAVAIINNAASDCSAKRWDRYAGGTLFYQTLNREWVITESDLSFRVLVTQ